MKSEKEILFKKFEILKVIKVEHTDEILYNKLIEQIPSGLVKNVDPDFQYKNYKQDKSLFLSDFIAEIFNDFIYCKFHFYRMKYDLYKSDSFFDFNKILDSSHHLTVNIDLIELFENEINSKFHDYLKNLYDLEQVKKQTDWIELKEKELLNQT